MRFWYFSQMRYSPTNNDHAYLSSGQEFFWPVSPSPSILCIGLGESVHIRRLVNAFVA